MSISSSDSHYRIIAEECGRFLSESGCKPVLKNLPSSYGEFKKVKIRNKKRIPDQRLNSAFDNVLGVEIFKNTLIVNGEESFIPSIDDGLEPYFVFPIDKYKYFYSLEVQSSESSYSELLDTLFSLDDEEAEKIVEELLKFTYTNKNLDVGINSGSEIIFYRLPYFYALRKGKLSYNDILESVC